MALILIGEARNWIGDRFEAMASNTWKGIRAVTVDLPETMSRAGDAISETASNVGEGISGAWTSTKNGVSRAWDWTADKAGAAWGGVKTFAAHPFVNTWHGMKVAGGAIGGWAVYTYENPGRSAKLLGQGVLNGGAAIVGMAGDLGMFVVNTTGKVGTFAVNTATLVPRKVLEGTTAFMGLGEGQTDFPPLTFTKFEHDYMTSFPKATNEWTGLVASIESQEGRPLNGYEKFYLYGAQGVAETAAFIGVGVATAGVGGAALAAARGGSLTAKVVQTANAARATGAVAETAVQATTVSVVEGGRAAGGTAYKWLRPWWDDATKARALEERSEALTKKAHEANQVRDISAAEDFARRAAADTREAELLRERIEARGNRIRPQRFNTEIEVMGIGAAGYFGVRAYDQMTSEGDRLLADTLLGPEELREPELSWDEIFDSGMLGKTAPSLNNDFDIQASNRTQSGGARNRLEGLSFDEMMEKLKAEELAHEMN